jgi:hypothetical protein
MDNFEVGWELELGVVMNKQNTHKGLEWYVQVARS